MSLISTAINGPTICTITYILKKIHCWESFLHTSISFSGDISGNKESLIIRAAINNQCAPFTYPWAFICDLRGSTIHHNYCECKLFCYRSEIIIIIIIIIQIDFSVLWKCRLSSFTLLVCQICGHLYQMDEVFFILFFHSIKEIKFNTKSFKWIDYLPLNILKTFFNFIILKKIVYAIIPGI